MNNSQLAQLELMEKELTNNAVEELEPRTEMAVESMCTSTCPF